MSVLSKALRLIVLVGVISGCAAGTANQDVNDSGLTASTDTLASEASTFQVAETEQLASLGEAGIGLQLDKGKGFSRLSVMTTTQDPVVDVLTLAEPPRLVVDMLGSASQVNDNYSVENDLYIKNVRLGGHSDRTRVVLDLTSFAGDDLNKVDHRVDTATGQVTITLFEPSVTGDISSAPVQVAAATDIPATSQSPSVTQEDISSQGVDGDALRLTSLNIAKTESQFGMVTVGLTDTAAFELRRTAPSEYVLRIPGSIADESTQLPLIAPTDASGIRTARVAQEPEGAVVRMFVDTGIELRATAQGNNIVVNSTKTPSTFAAKPEARAQLAEEGVEEEEEVLFEEEGGDNGGVVSADGSKIYAGRLISLDLQDTDIDNALRIIAEVSNLNIIASDDVRGKVTLRLIDVPWDQALDVILKTNGLDQVLEGNVIRIAPVEKLRAEREALKEAKRAAEELEDLQVKYIRVSYARVNELQEQVESVLTERGTVTIDERTNQLIIKDIAKGQKDAAELVGRLDLRTPQVLLETQIIESTRGILRELGFQWNYNFRAGPQYGNATGSNFPNSVEVGGGTADGSGNIWASNFAGAISDTAGSAITAVLGSADGTRDLAARLTALEEENKVRVISRPQVATVNNKQAEIKSVETVRVRLPDSGLSVATGSGASAAGGGSSAFEEIDVGIELRMTPQASPDYYVLLDIEANSSTFGSEEVDGIPSTLERTATSTVLVKSGTTFALGGVYRLEDQDSVSGIPFLKDVPVLGHLFRSTGLNKADQELIFFITPHIVEGSFDEGLM